MAVAHMTHDTLTQIGLGYLPLFLIAMSDLISGQPLQRLVPGQALAVAQLALATANNVVVNFSAIGTVNANLPDFLAGLTGNASYDQAQASVNQVGAPVGALHVNV